MLNKPSTLFKQMLSNWHFDVISEQTDDSIFNFVAEMANHKDSVCVGLMEKAAIPRLYGLTFILDGYGLILRQRYREQGDGVFVFVDHKTDELSEFDGNKLHVRPTL